MRLKSLAAAALVVSGALLSTPVLAKTDLGTLDTNGPSFSQVFWRFFGMGSTPGAFIDVYTFKLASASTAAGGTIDFDWGALDLSLTSASLSGGTLGNNTLVDNTPARFSFGGLGMGDYALSISGMLTPENGRFGGAGYMGTIHAVASPVPEPGTLAMALTAFGALWLTMRRRKGRTV